MPASDGLLARIRLPGGSLTPDQARVVAETADQHGNGTVELTARGNLQIRGLRSSAVEAAAQKLFEAGVADRDEKHDALRQVSCSPLTGHDPSEAFDATPLTARLVSRLAGTPGLDRLPAKFSIAIDTGGIGSVRHLNSDLNLGFERDGDGELRVRVELGRSLDQADGRATFVRPDAALEIATRVAQSCSQEGQRMSELVAARGREAVCSEIAAGFGPWREASPKRAADRAAPIGRLPHPQAGRINVGGAPLLGRIQPDPLRRLAEVARSVGAGLRITPFRGVVLTALAEVEAPAVISSLEEVGIDCEPRAAVHLISSCAGRPGCASAEGDTLQAARQWLADGKVTERIHLVGCEKRCGASGVPTALVTDAASLGGEPQ